MNRKKKRLLLAVGSMASIGAVVALATGVTFGLFSATQSSSGNTLTAGTVTLNTPVVTNCTVTKIVPGDSGNCTIAFTYSGSEFANLGLDLEVAGTPGTPVATYDGTTTPSTPAAKPGLYDNSATGLQYTITDDSSTSYTTSGLSSSDSSVANLLIAKAAATGAARTITIHWEMPIEAGNGYQAAATAMTAIVHAVQSDNNPFATACTLGTVCGTLSDWS
jgi:spore coat-associated protein N